MAPKPKSSRAQVQRITITLRNICKHYPAGAGVLRELLQNADDAGATTVEFFLDSKTYTETPLIHEGLEQYQGQSLLIYNNSVFKEGDFESLSRPGDSLKQDDPFSTGKFGHGFNSVFNYTDAPSVLSGTSLLLLDPHHSWSKDVPGIQPGGPIYDTKECCQDPEIKNQLAAFKAFDVDRGGSFDGTVIRLPLRSSAQAQVSHIVHREAALEDILDAFGEFIRELKGGGILFLRNITSVTFRQDGRHLASMKIIGDDNSVSEMTRGGVSQAMMKFHHLQDGFLPPSITQHFLARISTVIRGKETQSTFRVQHYSRRDTGDPTLDEWASEQKLLPIVAVAAMIDSQEKATGRLFSFLPLPIPTSHPLHIHGIWALAPDRRRLTNGGGSELRASQWNTFLLETCVATAWTDLLVKITETLSSQQAYQHWPDFSVALDELGSTLTDKVARRIVVEDLAVWPLANGYVKMTSGYFSVEGELEASLVAALGDVEMPLVLVPTCQTAALKAVVQKTQREIRWCNPSAVRAFLGTGTHLSGISSSTRCTLLSYCIRDGCYSSLHALPLFPMLDGSFSSLRLGPFFCARDTTEAELFGPSRRDLTMDLTTLTDSSVSLLHSHISEQKTSKIRYRTLVDLQDDWPSICGQPCSENEFIFYDDKLPQVINKVWDWIGARLVEEMDLIDSFQSLHLLPMKGKKLRKLRGALTSPAALVTDPASKIGKLLYELTAIDELRGPPIIDKGLLAASAMETIQRLASKHPGMEIAQSNTIRFLARWLFAGKHLIVDASKSWKEEIVECLSEVLKETSDDHQAITEAVPMIRQLPIFRRVKNRHVTQTALCHVKYIRTRTGQFDREYSPLQLEWSSITDDATNVKADLLPVIPDIADLEFYDVSNVDGRFVATFIPILGPGDLEYLLRSRIVPWLCNELTKTPSTVKKTFIDFIFDNTPKFSNEWRSFLRRQDIVPLQRIGNCQQEFGSLMQVIDLKSLTLRALYFAEEKVFPDENFARRFDAVLASCNIRRSITADLIKERIEFYARCGKDIGAVAKRVKYMLQLPSLSAILSDSAVQHTISNRIWIPASSPTNLQLTMMAAKACRDERDRDLIDGVLGTLDYRVDRTWRLALGWKEPLGLAELITQLERWVNAKIFEKVDAVLHYIKRNVGKAEYVSALSDVQWVLGASSNYFTPSHVFSRGDYAAFSSLVPYLDTVDRQFYAKHTALINDLAVEETPSLEILLSVQEELGTSAPLADHGFKVAVAIMKLAAQTFPRGMLNNLMAPDEQRRLTKIADLTCSDTDSRNPNLESLKFVHPDVPPSILQRLEITSIRETIIRGEVEELDHEEEYAQQESLTTTIRDTLERYTVKSVFNEYLANADDCGASEIRWLLDDRAAGIHSSDLLLTHELRVTLGPALLVYNDKEFSEDDFLGFRRIGQGSKRANVDTVGMFGRGAITMYHYTDVPMLISGSSMVIFDPQGRVLPRRRSGERKLGVRLPLSYVRRVCPDQLAPFRGVFGFQDTDHFHGTIFRFALRNPECQTELTETTSYASLSKTKRQFEGYFNDARASLLFLRHVSKVEYHVQGQQQPAWSVSAERPPLSGFVFPLRVHYEQLQLGGRSNEGADDWWVAIADIENAPKEIEYPWKRALKRIECGVAACVKASAPVKPRIFCVLPTPFPNSLPISIHASFAISADRQTIPYQDSARVSESSWNQWLIEEQLPDLYLRFLKDLALSTNGIYDFWPTRRALPHDTFQLGKIQEAFWKRLSANSEYHDLALFPVTTPTKSSGQLLPGQSQHRRTPKNMATLRNGEFDLLSGPVSELLRPLLSRVCDNLVCLPDGPRREIADVVKSINGISLSSSYLCEVFKRPKGVTVLQEYASSNEKIASLLHEMMPKNRGPMTTTDERTCSESWEVLMGCTIVPLEDGSLGTLLGAAVKDAPIYYLATVEELSLFEFASDIMVRHLLPTKQACALSAPPLSAKGVMKKSTNLDTIADTNFFNIKRISVSDSGKILRHSQCPIQSRGVSLAAKVRWLRSFWQWMNNNSADSQTAVHASQLTQCTLADLPIYPAESGMVIKTPSQFELHACVLQSEDKEDLELFQKIPGLVVIESLCVPWALRQDETDLEAPNARLRFLEALARLQNTTDLQTSLNENLDEKLAKKLQRLVVDFCTLCNHDALNPLLKRLPIWPRYRKTSSPGLVSTYMASEHAFACDNSYVHLPWMPRLDRCILPEVAVRYRNILHRLGVTVMSTLERLPMIIKHLPKAIDENRYPGIWPRYEGFLAHLHQKCLSVALKDPKIALKDVGFIPDGTGALRTACSLFEHSDPLFIAAFRVESNVRFPHHSVRHHQDLLLRLGMRRRQHGNLQWEDYIECASAIQQRYADRMSDVDEELLRDATVVFDRIRGDSAHLKTWPKSCWERIFKIGNAPTLSSNTIAENSSYRHGRMQQIAGRTPLRSIESSTPKKYLSISWSSSAYVEHEPPEHVVSLLPRAGAPLPSKVYKHLTYLMGIREFVAGNELVAFLKEIRDCYDFLQQHMPGETYFTTKQDRVWVNLESTELEYVSMSDFEASITSVDLLCLKSAVDPLPAKAVRPFLVPYEKLLKAFGCKSIQRRKINTTLLARERQPSVMTEIHRFRSEGKLVDVTFKAQDQLIRAHRVVLAASWGYCATLFTGSQWKESLKPSEPIELDDLTAQTVETMVEYAYSGSYVWPKVSTSDDNDSIADDLDELLDLLRGTDRMQIVAFHGEVEAHLIENAEIYIRPDNVKEVQKLADQAQARSLKNHCDGFIEDNKDIVEVCSPERS